MNRLFLNVKRVKCFTALESGKMSENPSSVHWEWTQISHFWKISPEKFHNKQKWCVECFPDISDFTRRSFFFSFFFFAAVGVSDQKKIRKKKKCSSDIPGLVTYFLFLKSKWSRLWKMAAWAPRSATHHREKGEAEEKSATSMESAQALAVWDFN